MFSVLLFYNAEADRGSILSKVCFGHKAAIRITVIFTSVYYLFLWADSRLLGDIPPQTKIKEISSSYHLRKQLNQAIKPSQPLQDKAVAVVQYMRNLETTAAAIKEAETNMRQRRLYIEKRAAALKQYVHDSMSETGFTKIECPFFKLGIQKNPAGVTIETERAVPVEFKTILVELPLADFERMQDQLPTHTVKETKISKSAVKSALQAGTEVPGALLTQGTRLAIRGG